MAGESDYGAFTEKFIIQPSSSPDQELPLKGLTFAVKDIFDMEGYVTGFGNPDWARTHSAATTTAPAVLAMLSGGATCMGRTVMDEMAYSINGENKHYGTPKNICSPDRLPGGSSSGSAVAVAGMLVDFSLGELCLYYKLVVFLLMLHKLDQKVSFVTGTDTGGSVRVPASYCGILGFRPSHGVVSTTGVIPLAQSLDTVGWFARDADILNRVGRVLLQLPEVEPVKPTHITIAEDCFPLLSIPNHRVTSVLVKSVEKLFGGHIVKYACLGDYVKDKVPTLKHFKGDRLENQEYNVAPLAALSSAYRRLERSEFKNNHGEWVSTIKPDLGPGISERVWAAVRSTDENLDVCHSVKTELRAALTALLGVSIPLGTYDNLPISVSLLAKHGSDGFLLNLVETLYGTLREQIDIAQELSY
ncbi:amidase 1-like isoform X5 [Rhododendron vialii]|uniref:amidase 1-like isoform X5 n=1 Tax=Rhododendron vialii TaxID=182163 RepID=UPI00265F769C|nr:amidase 1-like isoform X5 [Rhododendron vialii]